MQKNNMSIKAVIFDLDGTITEPYLDFDAIREEIGLEKNAGPILELMEKMPESRRQQIEKILYLYEQKAVEQSKLSEGTTHTLDNLRQAGISIGILTRNRHQNAMAVARKHNLQFDIVVGREQGPVKPDAFGVLHICEHLGVKACETLMVGDYLFDLQCAKAAGATAVLLKNHSEAEEFAQYADFTIEKIDEVLQIIERKNNATSKN